MTGVRVLFCDLDGTVRHGKDQLGRFVNQPEDVVVFPEAAARIRAWRAAGGVAFGVTNQGGIALGYMTWQDNAAIEQRTADLSGLNSIITCGHRPDGGCWCRKPLPGLVFGALRVMGLSGHGSVADPADCLMVGDMDTDRQCAERAGVPFQWAADWRAGA